MNYGYVVLARTSGNFLDRLIEWFSDSKFSHSFVTVQPQSGVEMCIEAASNGIDELEFDPGYRNNSTQSYISFQVNMPQEVIDAGIKYCLDKLETGYGYLAYPWFMWRFLLWKLFKKDIKAQNNWYTKDLVCSGLVRTYLDCPPVRDYLASIGVAPLFEGFGEGSCTPQDLYEIMQAHPTLFTLVESKGF